MTKRVQAVLWDLDGTLVDSEEYHWRSWKDTLDPFRCSGQRREAFQSHEFAIT